MPKNSNEKSKEHIIRDFIHTVTGKAGDSAINSVLEQLVDIYKADKAYIYELSDDGELMDNTYEVCSEGVATRNEAYRRIPVKPQMKWFEFLKNNGEYYVKDVESEIDNDCIIYRIFKLQNVNSIMSAPIVVDGKVSGMIGVDNPRENTDILLLLSVAAVACYGHMAANETKKLEETYIQNLYTLTHSSALELDHKEALSENSDDFRQVALKQAGDRLEELNDVLDSAGIGVWKVTYPEKGEPTMIADETTCSFMGIGKKKLTPEELYKTWFSRIRVSSGNGVMAGIEEAKKRGKSEITYIWINPKSGEEFIRAGMSYEKVPGVGEVYRGYAVNVTEVYFDQLTGLQNRRAYAEMIDNCEDADSIPENMCVVIADINGLKRVNDSTGHDAGDELIMSAAALIRGAFLGNNIYRTGGDEFCIVTYESKEDTLGRLFNLDVMTANWKGTLVPSMSISWGVSSKLENPDMNIQDLINLADDVMYENKRKYYTEKGTDRRKK